MGDDLEGIVASVWHKQRMRTLSRWMVGTIVMAAAAYAPTARASCALDIPATTVPFEGLSIPANAELRLINTDGAFDLTLPNGTTRFVGLVDDDRGQVLDIDLQTAGPGAYTFITSGAQGAFDVRGDDDTDAPDAPVVGFDITTQVNGPQLPIFDGCGPSPGIHRTAHLQVDGGAPGDVVVVNGRAVGVGNTVDVRVGDDDTGFAVRLRDLAGNESDATVVPIEGGCGGCTSADVSPFAIALLTLLRRRRR